MGGNSHARRVRPYKSRHDARNGRSCDFGEVSSAPYRVKTQYAGAVLERGRFCRITGLSTSSPVVGSSSSKAGAHGPLGLDPIFPDAQNSPSFCSCRLVAMVKPMPNRVHYKFGFSRKSCAPL
jgi:hypothetical protein